jgi:hypothetical protein
MKFMLNNLPAQMFSPFKVVYISFVLLYYHEEVFFNWCIFFIISIIFLAGEIIHNDYLRIRLNHDACKKCQCSFELEKIKAGLKKETI